MVIALIILGSVLLLISAALLSVVSLHFSYDEDFSFKVKFDGIRVFGSDGENEKKSPAKKEKKRKKEPEEQKGEKKENLFTKLRDKHGFAGAIKEIFELLQAILKRLKPKLKHILIRRLKLDIVVASPDAAKTAIEYGGISCAVYPALSLISSVTNTKLKQINVSADFEKKEPEFSFQAIIRVRVIYALIMMVGAFLEYQKFSARNEL